MLKKALSIVLVLTLLFAFLSGCGGKEAAKEDGSTGTGEKTETSDTSDTSDKVEETEEVKEETLNKDAQLRVWFGLFPEETAELQAIGMNLKKRQV